MSALNKPKHAKAEAAGQTKMSTGEIRDLKPNAVFLSKREYEKKRDKLGEMHVNLRRELHRLLSENKKELAEEVTAKLDKINELLLNMEDGQTLVEIEKLFDAMGDRNRTKSFEAETNIRAKIKLLERRQGNKELIACINEKLKNQKSKNEAQDEAQRTAKTTSLLDAADDLIGSVK